MKSREVVHICISVSMNRKRDSSKRAWGWPLETFFEATPFKMSENAFLQSIVQLFH